MTDYETLNRNVYAPLDSALRRRDADPMEILDMVVAVFMDASVPHVGEGWEPRTTPEDPVWKSVVAHLDPIWNRKREVSR